VNQHLPSPWFLIQQKHTGRWYVQESLLVLGSVSLLTLSISLLHLPTHTGDSLLLYLVLILLFAVLRGLYDAVLASIPAFFLFDYLFIPPDLSLQASKFEDVLGLLIFLFVALLTSYLASALQMQFERGQQKELQSRLLYQLVQTLNRQETLEKQLELFADYFEEIFASSGVQECAFLLPEPEEHSTNSIDSTEFTTIGGHRAASSPIKLSETERHALQKVYQQKQDTTIYDSDPDATALSALPRKRWWHLQTYVKRRRSHDNITATHLIPLQSDGLIKGILRLRLLIPAHTPPSELFWSTNTSPSSDAQIFFSTLLEHAIAVIQKEQLRQEQIQYQIIQQTERLRSALITSVSHDLRRPLTNIKAAAESLLHKPIQNEDERSFLLSIERESDWLDSLIENLLDMSRIEAGALHPQTVWYEIDVLIYDVLLRMQPSLQQRHAVVEIPDKLPLVAIDTVLIDQVLTNLLTNAISYTPPATDIIIQVVVEALRLLIRIIDKGPGIAETEREHIFEKFYRLGTGSSKNVAGLGLGLSICRGIIEAHHGQIWVEDNPQGGAIFALTLPYTPTQGNVIDE
jgi:Osmosensitive K+ channel histidine kinase